MLTLLFRCRDVWKIHEVFASLWRSFAICGRGQIEKTASTHLGNWKRVTRKWQKIIISSFVLIANELSQSKSFGLGRSLSEHYRCEERQHEMSAWGTFYSG